VSSDVAPPAEGTVQPTEDTQTGADAEAPPVEESRAAEEAEATPIEMTQPRPAVPAPDFAAPGNPISKFARRSAP